MLIQEYIASFDISMHNMWFNFLMNVATARAIPNETFRRAFQLNLVLFSTLPSNLKAHM